ncbi:MAG: hypothetical protein AAFP19_02795 [Bacteroidota bacterium]
MDKQILDDQFNLDQATIKTPEEVKNINLIKLEVNESIGHIRGGQKALFFLCCFVVFGLIVQLSYSSAYGINKEEAIIEGLILFSVYLSCALFVPRRPKLCLILGMAFYTFVIFLSALVDVANIYRGILVKLVIFFYLVKAIQASIQLEKKLLQLRQLGVPYEEIELAKKLKEMPRTILNASPS